MTRILLLAGVALALATGTAVAATTATATATATVQITDRLEPAEVTVPAGGTLTWRNADEARHRIRSTSGPTKFDSGNLDPGQTWSLVLPDPGEYRYADARDDDVAAYHGRITVTGTAAEATRPTGATRADSGATGTGSATGAGATADGAANISMVDRSFSPATVSVPVGATVTWTNTSDDEHTVTADDGAFDSGELQPGARFEQTFTEPGTVGFLCVLHSGMRGTVVVGDAPPDAAADAPAAPGPASGDDQGAAGGAAPASSADVAEAVEVEVRDFAFGPESVEVATGATVTWRHVGQAPHTVTAEDGGFDSGQLATGDTFAHTFTEPGTFAYLCSLHPEMVATATVAGSAVPAADQPAAGDGSADRSGSDDQPGATDQPGPADEPGPGDASAAPAGGAATDPTLTAASGPPTGMPAWWLAALAGMAVLVSGAVLVGAWRIERVLRTVATPRPPAPPAAPPGRART